MNKYIALFLAMLMLLPPVSKVVYVVDYSLNKQYIISVYCINRDTPQLACEGKCHLKKVLASSDDTEKVPVRNEKTEILYFIASAFWLLFSTVKTPDTLNTFYLSIYTYRSPTDVFHPPPLNC